MTPEPDPFTRRSLTAALAPHVVRLILYALAAKVVLFVFLTSPGLNAYKPARFSAMLDGTANRPYVQRVLVPLIVRGVAQVTPPDVRERLAERYAENETAMRCGWEREYLFEYRIAVYVLFACFLGFFYSMKWLVATQYPDEPLIGDFAVLCAPAALPLFFQYATHLYDPCTLFLFTLAAYLLARRWIVAFYVCFVLATLCKETAALLVPLFLLVEFPKRSKRSLAVHAIALSALWALVRAGTVMAFKDNGGGVVEWHLERNLRFLSGRVDARLWLQFAVVVVAVGVLFIWRWRLQPRLLRLGFVTTALPLFGACLFLGWIDELRDYYETVPFLLPIAASAALKALRSPPSHGRSIAAQT